MALMERDIVLTGCADDGTETVDLPDTRLGCVEDTADVKAVLEESDYIPVISGGQMKKITLKALANAAAGMIMR